MWNEPFKVSTWYYCFVMLPLANCSTGKCTWKKKRILVGTTLTLWHSKDQFSWWSAVIVVSKLWSRVCASLVSWPRLGMCRYNAKIYKTMHFGSAPGNTLSLATRDSSVVPSLGTKLRGIRWTIQNMACMPLYKFSCQKRWGFWVEHGTMLILVTVHAYRGTA